MLTEHCFYTLAALAVDVSTLFRPEFPLHVFFHPYYLGIRPRGGSASRSSFRRFQSLVVAMNLDHVLQQIQRFTVAVAVFEPKTVQNDVYPAGEPAAGRLARMLPQRLFD